MEERLRLLSITGRTSAFRREGESNRYTLIDEIEGFSGFIHNLVDLCELHLGIVVGRVQGNHLHAHQIWAK